MSQDLSQIYRIEENKYGMWEVIRESDEKVVSIHDTGLKAKKSLEYRLSAINKN